MVCNDSCPPPQERDKSINNLLIYFTSLSSNLIAGSFVSVEGVEGGRLGGVNKGRAEGCRGVEETKSSAALFALVLFPSSMRGGV